MASFANWNATRLLMQWGAFHNFPKTIHAIRRTDDNFAVDKAKDPSIQAFLRTWMYSEDAAGLRGLFTNLITKGEVRLYPPGADLIDHPEYNAVFMTAIVHAATTDPNGTAGIWRDGVTPFVLAITHDSETQRDDLFKWNMQVADLGVHLKFSPDVLTRAEPVEAPQPPPPTTPPPPAASDVVVKAMGNIQISMQDIGTAIQAARANVRSAEKKTDIKLAANQGYDNVRRLTNAILKEVTTVNRDLSA